jgi:predicted metal-dependent phosphoesterase TrpH
MDEAFERFLKKDRPAWVPKFKISALDAIELIHRAGGLAVMAHPGLNRTDESIPKLVEAGLDGLECFHTKHNAATAEHYARMARELGLAITGGSDCHGLSKGKPLIGTIKLPYVYLEQLEARLAEPPSRASKPDAVAPHPALNRNLA